MSSEPLIEFDGLSAHLGWDYIFMLEPYNIPSSSLVYL